MDDLLRISQHIGLRLKGCIQRKQLFLLQGFNRHFFLAYKQWNEIRSPEMVWLHGQRCRIKEHESGSPTSSSCVKGFHANRKILCDTRMSISHGFRYLGKGVSPVPCLGAPHLAIHKSSLAKLDVEYRRLMLMVVGPPAGTTILHHHGTISYMDGAIKSRCCPTMLD